MSIETTFLAVFLGSKSSPRMAERNALPESERTARERDGMAAWKRWAEINDAGIAGAGGPLGKTKRVSLDGVTDVTNEIAAFVIVRAASHAEAAALFEGHPHFTIFPGDAVEIMPVLPMPGR